MNWLLRIFSLAILLVCISCGSSYSPDPEIAATLPDKVDYNFHIKPILSDRCYTCHGPDANQRQGDFRLDIEEEAFVEAKGDKSSGSFILSPGSLSKSEVFHRIISDDPEYMMPPPESNLYLSEGEKALIARWIEQGAEFKAHWAFVPPVKAELPVVKNKDWIQNPIDHFILDQIERRDLEVSEKANKETLLRRITLDLTGLPPTPEEIDAFLDDSSEDAYEKAIDRLMESPHYGERLALEWLDAARYADSHGYQDDGMRNTWPWREWVIKTFNKNMPFDQFLIEQLAGDLLENPTRDQLLATCFNRNHPQSQEGGVVEEEYRVEYVADRTNTFGKALMGLTMECARCHDHKYDPISQKEYYELSAFFNNNNDWGIVPYNGEACPTVMLPTPEEEEKLAALKEQMAPLEAKLVSENYVEDFKKWLNKSPQIDDLNYGLVADFDFEKEVEASKARMDLDKNASPGWAGIGKDGTVPGFINQAKGRPDAAILGDKDRKPEVVEGKFGNGIRFLGDCGVRFNRDLDFDRHQPFSVSVWVKQLKAGEKGPIFNNTNGDFEGYRGWICKLNEDGTLSFQLNYVWPDNSIDYQTKDTLVVGEWTHISMTYDGSSKAEGLRFFVNGKVPEYTLHRDNLKKSLLHSVKGSNWSSFPFMVGKEKERTIENFEMDELKVYNRQLSEIEVQKLFNIDGELNPSEDQKLESYLVTGKNARFNQTLKELTEIRKEENLVSTDILEVMVMNDKKEVRPTFILDRGAYDAPTEEVKANTPTAISSMPEDLPKNRLGLAKWLTSGEHPLTARVAVNRFWYMLFGKGIVATQDDFGSQGNLPSHPELLDWLAVDFMENGWDVKAFIKKIMLSATYQQSSVPSESVKEKDSVNDWYAYFPAHRLSAESIRDNALAASGLLVRTIGGKSVYPYQPLGIWKALATRNATVYTTGTGDDLYRRSMYTIWKRSSPPPSMMNFDAPDRYYCVVSRQKTATPLQSLVLMNDPQFMEAAKVLGVKAMKEGGETVPERIDFLYKSLIGRSAEEKEKDLINSLYEAEKEDLEKDKKRALALLDIGEKKIEENFDKIDLAAHTLIASTIMNFDEFVMKR